MPTSLLPDHGFSLRLPKPGPDKADYGGRVPPSLLILVETGTIQGLICEPTEAVFFSMDRVGRCWRINQIVSVLVFHIYRTRVAMIPS